MVWIEPSAVCNLDCPECPTAAGRGTGIMSGETFRQVLDALPPSVRIVNLWHRGEPLTAPQFPEMVAEASRRHIWTQTVTNGTLLNRGDRAQKLVEAGINKITIAIDGSVQETYAQYRVGGRLEDVWEGTEFLLRYRQLKKMKRKPKVVIEVLLRDMDSQEWREIYRKGIAMGVDKVLFKTYRVTDLSERDRALTLLPKDPLLWRYRLSDGSLKLKSDLKGCRRVGFSFVIAYNGEVMPCCFWVHPFGLGSILKESWQSLWRGPLRQFFANVNSPGTREKIPMCTNCTEGLTSLYISPRQVFKFSEKATVEFPH